jgi:hypothetical protein
MGFLKITFVEKSGAAGERLGDKPDSFRASTKTHHLSGEARIAGTRDTDRDRAMLAG